MSRGRWQSEAALSLMAEFGSDDPREAILEKAREVVEALGMTDPPFSPKIIASFCGIHEVAEVPLDLAGCLLPVSENPPRIRMLLRREDSPARRNFTCNHESAHTLFPSYWRGPLERKDRHTGAYGPRDQEEYLCDLAAAELLMPREPFAWAAYDHGLTPDVVPHLSTQFAASLEAAARRLVDLKLWLGGVILWSEGWRPSELGDHQQNGAPLPPRKLRVQCSHMGPDLARGYVPKHRSIRPESLVTHCLRTGEATEGYEEIPAGNGWRIAYVQSRRIGAGSRQRVCSFVSQAPPLRDGTQ